MKYYVGIDLHSNNNVVAIIDEEDKIVFLKKIDNNLNDVLLALARYKEQITAVAVESTFNWYWLVDGLMDEGYKVKLANPSAMKQYEGLKYRDDKSDARWIAHMLRLGILPTGYIYPQKERPVRDLLRKRSQLVRMRTTNLLSIHNLFARNIGASVSGNRVKQLKGKDVDALFEDELLALAVKSNIAVMERVEQQIKIIEREVKKRARLRPEFKQLLTVHGIGETLALTIALETGDISRFPSVGDFASYCRCVDSKHLSNNKKKGEGNSKNGNKYLSWAFVEAATFAVRYNELARRFYQRKSAKKNKIVAKKALANKLARASYFIMRDKVPFDNERLFTT